MTKKAIKQEISDAQQACEAALTLAKSLGATHAEVSLSRQRGLTVCTRLGETETVEFNQDGAMGITVYHQNRKGSASTADLSELGLEKTVRAASDIAKFTSEDEFSGLADAECLEMTPPDLDLFHPHAISPEEAAALCKASEDAGFAKDSRIVNSDGASLGAYDGFRVYANTHGQNVGFPSTRFSLSCGLIAQHEEEMERNFAYTVSRRFDQLRDAAEIGREAAEETLSHLQSKQVPTAKMPVIFRADIASSLFSHLVSAIGGGAIYRKSSFLLDKLHQQVMSSMINIHEDPHIKQGLASSPFDREGVKTAPREIITDGVLNSWLLTSYSARKLGLQTTGHSGGIHNWLVDSTTEDLAAMIKQMDKGLLVTDLMGQGVNTVTGDYSRGAAGFWIENGQIQYPVSEITIAGNLADMFMNIEAIGSDIDKRGSVACGSVLISNIQVAGN